jgi:hypothetical protein
MVTLPTRAERERALVALDQLIPLDNPGAIVSVDELAEAAGIGREQAILAFHWMVEHAFAAGYARDRSQITITVKGRDEVNHLRMPKWRRWWYTDSIRQPLIVSVVAGLISGVIGGLIVKLLVK